MAPKTGPVIAATPRSTKASRLWVFAIARAPGLQATDIGRRGALKRSDIAPGADGSRPGKPDRAHTLYGLGAMTALLLGVSLSPNALAASTIEPGYWSYKASTLITGAKSGDQCVRPDKIDEFLSGPHNRHYRCTYPVREVGGGAATFVGECVSKGGNRYRISLSGHYEPTAFELSGHVAGSIVGLQISLPVEIKARRVSAECPAGSK